MKFANVALLVILCVIPSVKADEYSAVTVEGQTYYGRANDTTLYTRSSYQQYWTQPGYYYYSYGCRYWQPSYTYSTTEYKYTPYQVNTESPDAEIETLRAFRARDQLVLSQAARDRKSANVRALASQLGLNANIPNYGAGIFPLSNYGSYQFSAAGYQGNTVYAYPAYEKVTIDTKGVDPLVALQLLQQTVIQSGETYRLIQPGLKDSIDSAVARQLMSNQTIAKAVAASTLAGASGAAVEAPPTVSGTRTTVVPAPPSAPPAVMPRVDEEVTDDAPFFVTLKAGNCASCHSGNKISGNFDVTKYNPSSAAPAEILRVWKYVRAPDNEPHCPPKSSGIPRLTDERAAALIAPVKRK